MYNVIVPMDIKLSLNLIFNIVTDAFAFVIENVLLGFCILHLYSFACVNRFCHQLGILALCCMFYILMYISFFLIYGYLVAFCFIIVLTSFHCSEVRFSFLSQLIPFLAVSIELDYSAPEIGYCYWWCCTFSSVTVSSYFTFFKFFNEMLVLQLNTKHIKYF